MHGMIIRNVILLLCLVLLNAGCSHFITHRIPISDLESERYEVVGHLGVPLGWAVRAEAVVVDGDSTRTKRYLSSYLLDIVSINGKILKSPLRMEFSDSSSRMPSTHSKRYEDVEGQPTGGLNSEIKARINKGYVGNRYDILIYEEGQFSGFTTDEHPIHFMIQQGNVRGFKTSVCILQVYGVNESIRPYKSRPPVPLPSVLVTIPAGANSGIDPDFGAYSLTNAVPFYMDSTEVTKGDWDKVYDWALKHGYSFDNAGSGKTSNHPVNKVNWNDCLKWCNARSEKEGKTPCYTVSGKVYKMGHSVPDCNFFAKGYRLPTKTEWEYAARGGLSGKRFPWGDTISHRQANYLSGSFASGSYDVSLTDVFHPDYYEKTDDDTQDYTGPAGSFAANGYGLYDMAGNVQEWCWDYTSDLFSYVKGGCWIEPAEYARCGDIDALGTPSEGTGYIGFRSVCR
jgi:formylglycine-generating enzyme required for sulfatase activity/uncharacterized protein YceK